MNQRTAISHPIDKLAGDRIRSSNSVEDIQWWQIGAKFALEFSSNSNSLILVGWLGRILKVRCNRRSLQASAPRDWSDRDTHTHANARAASKPVGVVMVCQAGTTNIWIYLADPNDCSSLSNAPK